MISSDLISFFYSYFLHFRLLLVFTSLITGLNKLERALQTEASLWPNEKCFLLNLCSRPCPRPHPRQQDQDVDKTRCSSSPARVAAQKRRTHAAQVATTSDIRPPRSELESSRSTLTSALIRLLVSANEAGTVANRTLETT